MTDVTMDKIVSLSKRRGFVFPSSEIYGGVGSTYDYGHYGVLLKQNVKNEWWRSMLQERDDIVALDSAIILHPRVWEASGHLTEARQFNLMFQTHVGPVQDEGSVAYLRPETAQGIFVNFKNTLQYARK